MEVLAGDDDLDVELVRSTRDARSLMRQTEHGVRYRFNFAEVYWNTRLSTEHLRLVDQFQPGELIVDAFAGVGPFALPAARKGCFVCASDLNPASARALAANVELNKVCSRSLSRLIVQLGAHDRTGNADGRAWIAEATVEAWERPFIRPPRKPARSKPNQVAPVAAPSLPPPPRLVSHFIMNLPASALTFLDAYRGIYRPLLELPDFDADAARRSRPMVHCYCFSRSATAEEATPDICEVRMRGFSQADDTARNCGSEAFRRARVRRALQRLLGANGRAQVCDVPAVLRHALGGPHCIRLTCRDRHALPIARHLANLNCCQALLSCWLCASCDGHTRPCHGAVCLELDASRRARELVRPSQPFRASAACCPASECEASASGACAPAVRRAGGTAPPTSHRCRRPAPPQSPALVGRAP